MCDLPLGREGGSSYKGHFGSNLGDLEMSYILDKIAFLLNLLNVIMVLWLYRRDCPCSQGKHVHIFRCDVMIQQNKSVCVCVCTLAHAHTNKRTSNKADHQNA